MISNRCTAEIRHSEIRAGTSFNFYVDWISRICRAGTALEMAHSDTSGGDYSFGITERLHIFPVDAQAERPRSTCMRCVKSPQPGHRAGVRFMVCRATCHPAQALCPFVRETRGEPVPRLPHMNLGLKLSRVPTPLPDLLFRRKYSNKPKWHHSFEVRNVENRMQV